MQCMYKWSKDYHTYIKVLILLHLYACWFKVYGQCVKKIKAVQHAAPILFMQKYKLVQRDFVQ